MKILNLSLLLVVLIVLVPGNTNSQNFYLDGKLGFSIFSGGGYGTTALLLVGGLDIPSGNQFYLRPELNITTHSGTPIEIGGLAKYLIPLQTSQTTLYVDGGLGIWFYTGGPYLSLDFGGGAIFPTSDRVSIPVELKLGPIFSGGQSVFQFAITSGIRLPL